MEYSRKICFVIVTMAYVLLSSPCSGNFFKALNSENEYIGSGGKLRRDRGNRGHSMAFKGGANGMFGKANSEEYGVLIDNEGYFGNAGGQNLGAFGKEYGSRGLTSSGFMGGGGYGGGGRGGGEMKTVFIIIPFKTFITESGTGGKGGMTMTKGNGGYLGGSKYGKSGETGGLAEAIMKIGQGLMHGGGGDTATPMKIGQMQGLMYGGGKGEETPMHISFMYGGDGGGATPMKIGQTQGSMYGGGGGGNVDYVSKSHSSSRSISTSTGVGYGTGEGYGVGYGTLFGMGTGSSSGGGFENSGYGHRK